MTDHDSLHENGAPLASVLRGLVRAAVYVASADGELGEAEAEALIDAIRELVDLAVGAGRGRQLARTSLLLDEARAARADLRRQGDGPYVSALGASFAHGLQREVLVVCWRVIAADGVFAPQEAEALRRLASAMGLARPELAAAEASVGSTASAETLAAVAGLLEPPAGPSGAA